MNKYSVGFVRFLLICIWWPLQALATAASPVTNTTAPPESEPEATVKFFHRDIVTFRGSLYGVSAPDRAKRAQIRLQEELDLPRPYKITRKTESAGVMVQINGATTFFVTPDDANRLQDESADGEAHHAASALERAIAESQESRDLQAMLHALGKAALATCVALALGWLLSRARRSVTQRLLALTQRRTDGLRLGGVKLLHQNRLSVMVDKTLKGFFQLLLFVLLYEWLSYVLASFPFTRAWGEMLNGFLWGLTLQLGTAIAMAIPGLFTALVIFYLARASGRMLDGFFERIRNGRVQVSWLEADVAEPTRRIVKAAL